MTAQTFDMAVGPADQHSTSVEAPLITEQTVEVVSFDHPRLGYSQTTDQSIEQLFRRRIASRSSTLCQRMLFLASHTVTINDDTPVPPSGIVEMNSTVDAVLTSFISKDRQGIPRFGLCFRMYRPHYDHRTGIVTFGAVNLVTKDGSLPPNPYTDRGAVFSSSKFTPRTETNYNLFLNLFDQTEAVSHDRSLLTRGPWTGQALLGFDAHSFDEVSKEFGYRGGLEALPVNEETRTAIRNDCLDLVQPGALPPDCVLSPGGKVVEISGDDNDVLVVFSGGEIITIPEFAELLPEVRVGLTVSQGRPLAYLNMKREVRNWEELIRAIGPDNTQSLESMVWSNSIYTHEGSSQRLICIPNRYVCSGLINKHRVVMRDLRACVGRVVYNPTAPSEFRFDNSRAFVSVWDMGGPADEDRLTFDWPGAKVTFYQVREEWLRRFEEIGVRQHRTTTNNQSEVNDPPVILPLPPVPPPAPPKPKKRELEAGVPMF